MNPIPGPDFLPAVGAGRGKGDHLSQMKAAMRTAPEIIIQVGSQDKEQQKDQLQDGEPVLIFIEDKDDYRAHHGQAEDEVEGPGRS